MKDQTGVSRRTYLRGTALTGAALVGLGARSSAAAATEIEITDPVEVTSFDGVTITGTLYEPASDGPHPAVLMTHGWGSLREDVSDVAKFHAERGYTVLTYDSRGFGDSSGIVSLNGPAEVGDVSALVDWLGEYDGVENVADANPRVGMDGLSYAGAIQLLAAAEEDRLDAIIPRWSWHNLVNNNAMNDVPKDAWLAGFLALGREVSDGDLQQEFIDTIQQMLDTGTVTEDVRKYYLPRSPSTMLDDIDTPTLLITGLYDTLTTPNEALRNLRGLQNNNTDVRLVLFNGGHSFISVPRTQTETDYINAAKAQWLDKYVRGEDVDANLPPVSLYIEEEDTFRGHKQLPPTNATIAELNLGNAAQGGSTQLRWTPSNASQSDTIATFDFPVTKRTEIVGMPEVSLSVTPTGKRTYLFGRLYDLAPDGSEIQIKNQRTAIPVPEAGHVEEELVATQWYLDAGHTLRFELSLEDNQYTDSQKPAGTVIHHNRQNESSLAVPVRH